MTNYDVIFDHQHERFTKAVNKAISQGWECQGGVSIALDQHFPYSKTFAQAMIKPPNPIDTGPG